MTLEPGQIVSGSVTLAVAAVSSAALLSSNGLAITAQLGAVATPSSGGGLSGFAGLVNALESLANYTSSIVSTLGDISSQGAEWASGGISDSSFGPSISSRIDLALSQLTRLTPGIEAIPEEYEMQELTQDSIGTVVNARNGAVQAFDVLQSLRKLTDNLVNLRKDVLPVLKAYLLQITGAAGVLTAVEAALLQFADSPPYQKQQPIPSNYTSNSTVASATKTSASSTSSTSATPSPYIIGTKEGTPLSAFKSFIQTLPDGGQGKIIQYENVRWQTYFTNLTLAQAQEVASQGIVLDVVDSTAAGFGAPAGALPHPSKKLRKRDAWDIESRPNSDSHLRIISTGNQLQINNKGDGGSLPNYMYDTSLGEGVTIYIIDSGCLLSHTVTSTKLRTDSLQKFSDAKGRSLVTSTSELLGNMLSRTNTRSNLMESRNTRGLRRT